ncbi:hypothetical protein RhiirC2_762342, partial [Rhizophagus irregularis]
MSRSISAKILWLIWIIGILAIATRNVKAQTPENCSLIMCTKTDGTEAVVATSEPSHLNNAQTFIAGQCPGETNITNCKTDCSGPYNPFVTVAYWTWKKCNRVTVYDIPKYICDASVLNVCVLGKDPQYPFN